nr:hypothetical protein [Micromonospora sp. DSM 115978]
MTGRKLLAASVGVVVGAGLITVVAASSAQAHSWHSVGTSGWAYTDSRRPTQSFVNPSGDAPIGAWVDEDSHKHRSRSYFSFDVSRFVGTVVHEARFTIGERSAADCTAAQPVELWRTDPIKPTTSWKSKPRRHELLGTVMAGGDTTCPGYLEWDIASTLRRLAEHNQQTLTVEIRVPHGHEHDLSHGRTLAPTPWINVTANYAPTVTRIGLNFPEWACGTETSPQPVGPRNYGLMVQGADADNFVDTLTGHFAAWPVGHDDQRSEQSGSTFPRFSSVEWEMSQYPHGTVVAWTARVSDGHDYSAWAEPCYVVVDRERPAAPLVTSAKYPNDGQPHGGPEVPGTFTFSPNGSADVVGYEWGMFGDTSSYIAAPAPGEPVTFEYTPMAFTVSLSVRSIDSASNPSPVTQYDFRVRNTAPNVKLTMGGVGLPSRLEISTNVAGVSEFGYRLDEQDEVRIPASAAGTADVQVVFPQVGFARLQVRSYIGAEYIGGRTQNPRITDRPFVESTDFAFPDHNGVVGRPGSFTFRPGRAGVVEYEYSFSYDLTHEDPVRIGAAADGSVVLNWIPPEPNWYVLTVRSIDADGVFSEFTQHEFAAIDTRPYVYSSFYPEYGAWGGVGIAGDFSFDTLMPDAEAFHYQLNDGPEQIVEAEFGSARVVLTPDRSGSNTLSVRTRFLDGSFSPTQSYTFQVSDTSS